MNFIRIFARIVRRSPIIAALNVGGLALGMTCAFIIGAYVWHESGYDRLWTNGDRIFRIVTHSRSSNDERSIAGTPVPLGAAIREEIPDVEDVVRFWNAYQPLLRAGERSFREEELYFTDPTAFAMFDIPFIRGSASALKAPRSVVLTESCARKYFGDEDPVGRTMVYRGFPEDTLTLTVTGVVRDLPSGTQLRFDALVSLNGVTTEIDNWGSTKNVWTYVLLRRETNASDVEAKLPSFARAHFGPQDPLQRSLHLQPLADVHLNARYAGGFSPPVSRATLTLALLVGLAILGLACINFTNLTTARALSRVRELSIRKVLGARRAQLARQVLGEILFFSIAAAVVALFASEALRPTVETFMLTRLDIPWTVVIIGAAAIVLGVTAAAGAYPAFVLSGFDSRFAMRGWLSGRRGGMSRKVLVVVQFVISIGLLSATLVIVRQLEFIRSKELGLTRDRIVVVPGTGHFEAMRAELMMDSRIVDVSVSHRIPLSTLGRDTRSLRLEAAEERFQFHTYIVDEHFLDTYGIQLLAGRPLPTVTAEGQHPFLLNERGLHIFGWKTPEEAIGKRVAWSGKYKTGEIVGVVRDFTVESLHEEIPPVVITTIPDERWWRDYVSIRTHDNDLASTLAAIERTWKRLTPEGAYEYQFVDDAFAGLHRDDTRLAQFVGAGTFSAIVIACLGLLGLATFATQQRTKEIGIRKVLGSSVGNLVGLLAKDFLLLVLSANVLAWPLAYFATERYLETFAYHVGFSGWTFLAAAGGAITVAFLVIAAQVWRAARANPVEALRYE